MTAQLLARLLSAALVAGCGRLEFGALGDAGSGDDAVAACRTWSAFSAPIEVAGIAAPYDDWGPTLTLDGRELYLSNWDEVDGGFTIGVHRRASSTDAWQPIDRLLEIVGDDTTRWALDASISEDAQRLYFTFQDIAVGSASIAYARRSADRFGPLVVFEELRSIGYNHEPHISVDELRLYYATDDRDPVPDGRSQKLVVATRATLDAPFAPFEVLTELDTTDAEDSPALSRDELEIIFASNRRAGTDFDLYRATRTARTEPFGAPLRIDELSSTGDDCGATFADDGATLYFNHAANRGGGDDAKVYRATRSCLD